MPLPFDATLKGMFADFLPDLTPPLGLAEFEPLRPLNVDLSTLSAATDIALGRGDPPERVVDLNFQSGPDDDLEGRIFMYNGVLYRHYRVPVHTVLVLLRPAADAGHLTGRLRYEGRPRKGKLFFVYEVIRLWQLSPRRFLRGGVGALPLALLCQLPTDVPRLEALAGLLHQVIRRLETEARAEDRAKLLTAAYVLLGLRVSQQESEQLFRGVQTMKESTTYQAILAEGRAEGEQKGRTEGRIETLQQTLLRLGQHKFGPPSRAERAAVLRIKDVARLEQLTERLLDVDSWQELLESP